MKLRTILMCIMLTLLAVPAFAAPGTVTGTVTDAFSQPVPGISVQLYFTGGNATTKTATTDSSGVYTVSSVTAASYKVLFYGNNALSAPFAQKWNGNAASFATAATISVVNDTATTVNAVMDAMAQPKIDLGSFSNAAAGTVVMIPVTLTTGGAALSTIGLTITSDPAKIVNVFSSDPADGTPGIGAASLAAGKSIQDSSNPGTYILLISSGTKVIGDGLLVNLYFQIAADATGPIALTSAPSASDPNGLLVNNVTGTSGNITYPPTAPGAPTMGSASAASNQATVSFTAPASDGGSAITGYTVTSNNGISASGPASPITVAGLANGTAYTFTVTATNSVGTGLASNPSNSVTPKGNQTAVTVTAPASASYGQAGVTASATGGNGTGAYGYSAGSSTACTVNATTGGITITNGIGTCAITAIRAADATFNASAPSAAATVTISKADQTTVTTTAPASASFGQTGLTASATGGSSTGAYSYDATGSTACTVNATTGAIAITSGSGTCSITAARAADSNYNVSAATAPATVAVSKATPVVSTWPTSSAVSFGETLASSVLSGGAATPTGTFAYTAPSTAPSVGTASQGVTFTPTDTANYNTAIGTVNVTVSKAAPAVSTWPTAGTINFGQALASSTLSGGSATPAGTFAFTTPATAPNAGTASQGVTFTPTDAANYSTATGTVSVTVTKANPSVTGWPTAGAITFGQALASSALNGGTSTPSGTFAFTTPATAPSVGSAAQGVTFTPADTTNYNTATGSVNVTVNKATPNVTTWPTASVIGFGQTLALSTLSGGSVTPVGSFAFTSPSTAPNAGSAAQGVTFTPTDTANYNPATGTVTVTVTKATPVVSTWPTAGAIGFGQTLAASALTGGSASTPGSFAFTTPATAPNAGTASQGVTFTPNDATNYSTVTGSVSVTVTKANPNVTTWPTASAIGFGQTLALSTLSGGSVTPVGSFTFTTPATAPSVGTALQGVTFTPTDTLNYNTATGSVNVTVNKATPNVTAWPTAGTIVFGQTLAASTLTGGASTPAGSFAFTNPATAPNAGTALQGVTFTPADTANYNTTTGTVSVTVTKAAPSVTTWPTAGAIGFGQTLATSALSGGASTPVGSFAFTTPATAPSAGNASQGVIFTPTDTANYSAVTGTVSVTVNKANPTVTTWPTASSIGFGQTLALSVLSGGSVTPVGSFAFTSPTTAPSVGSASQGVTFTPNDTANYNTVAGSVSVTVTKATPAVSTWPTAGAIVFGQTLASSALTGGSATPAGTFAFTTPATAPNAGTAPQGVTFTPSDTANYSAVTGTISVTVTKATPAVTTWPTAGAITFGQTLASSTLSGASVTPVGSFAFTAPTTAPNAGTALQGVTFTPTDTANYNTAAGTVSVTVNKATTAVTSWPTASAIGFGQTLASSTLSGGSVTPVGTFAFTAPSTAPNAGTTAQGVTFTPTDTANFKTAAGTVNVTVTKSAPAVTAWPTASAINFGQTLASSTLSGGVATPAGSFAFTTPATAPSVGSAAQGVTFTPTDTANYSTTAGTVSVTVNIAVPGAPTSIFAVPGATKAIVSFSAPAFNGGNPITGYTVTSSPAGGTDLQAGTTATTHTVTGLTNGTSYTFTVTANNGTFSSSASAASGSVVPVATPDAPTGAAAVASPGQAVVSFLPPAFNGGSAITGYTVTSTPGNIAVSGVASPITVTGLINATAYTFTVTATNSAGIGAASDTSAPVTPYSAEAPVLHVSTLVNGAVTNNATLNVAGKVTSGNGIASLKLNGATVAVNPDGSFSTAVTLVAGANTIDILATDGAVPPLTTPDTRTINLDTTVPAISNLAPADNGITNHLNVTVTGTVSETATVSITLNNGTPALAAMTGSNFTLSVGPLLQGVNTIHVNAKDVAGNETVASSYKITLTLDTQAPALAVTAPAQDIQIHSIANPVTIQGTVADQTGITVNVGFNGTNYPQALTAAGTYQQDVTIPAEGSYPVTVTATDEAGNISTVTRNVIYTPFPADSDGDGATTALVEVLDAFRHVYEQTSLTPTQLLRLDCAPLGGNGQPNPDGVVDTADVILLLRRTVGLVNW